jgi:hypothetical protein
MAEPALDRPGGAMSVRALAWLGGIDSFGRGEITRPALQHEGLFTGHAPVVVSNRIGRPHTGQA